jgi:hypothetical protein
MLRLTNVSAWDVEGSAFEVNGGDVAGRNVHVSNTGKHGFDLNNGARGDFSNISAIRADRAGFRAHKSQFILNRFEFRENDIGLDLEEGAHGDAVGGQIIDNYTADVRYRRDVLVGIFDTAARELRNLAWSTVNIDRVDAEWISSRILDTTDVKTKARWLMRWAMRFGGFIFSNVLWQAILYVI